jgi:hypothetical protein
MARLQGTTTLHASDFQISEGWHGSKEQQPCMRQIFVTITQIQISEACTCSKQQKPCVRDAVAPRFRYFSSVSVATTCMLALVRRSHAPRSKCCSCCKADSGANPSSVTRVATNSKCSMFVRAAKARMPASVVVCMLLKSKCLRCVNDATQKRPASPSCRQSCKARYSSSACTDRHRKPSTVMHVGPPRRDNIFSFGMEKMHRRPASVILAAAINSSDTRLVSAASC